MSMFGSEGVYRMTVSIAQTSWPCWTARGHQLTDDCVCSAVTRPPAFSGVGVSADGAGDVHPPTEREAVQVAEESGANDGDNGTRRRWCI